MIKLLFGQLFIGALVLLIAGAALPDQTIIVTMSSSTTREPGEHLSHRGLQLINFDAYGSRSNIATVYCSGQKIKVVSAYVTSILDFGGNAETEAILFPSNKTWYMVPLPTDNAQKRLNKDSVTNLVDLKRTTTLIGHETHLYKFYSKGSEFTTIGYVWVAPDIPPPPQLPSSFVSPAMNYASEAELRGTPLKVSVLSICRTLGVRATSVCEVNALSNNSIPASTFRIPKDYTKTTPLGFPLGTKEHRQ